MRGMRVRRLDGPIGATACVMALVLVAGCANGPTSDRTDGQSTGPSPSGPILLASPTASPGTSPAISSSSTPSATAPGDPFLGKTVVTISQDLRVRSAPRVAADSEKFEPLLPTGTHLVVIGGPVSASGYTWYQVEPVEITLVPGRRSGWIAAGDKDGKAWIALEHGAVVMPHGAISSIARTTADPALARAAAASVNAFGVELYRLLLTDEEIPAEENAVLSPASIVLALAMARAGATGATAEEMDRVLHTTGWNALGPGLNALDRALTSLNKTWRDSGDRPAEHQVALRIANGAFVQEDWAIEPSYLDRLAGTFGIGVQFADFITDREDARDSINDWVDAATAGRIPALLSPGALDQLTRLVLVNAIYMKAAWNQPFPPSGTDDRPFTGLAGRTTQVRTMFQAGEQEITYTSGDGWRATELRYEPPVDSSTNSTMPGLAMTIVVPDQLIQFEDHLDPALMGRITTALDRERAHLETAFFGLPGSACQCGCYPYSVHLYLPKFGVESRLQLAGMLATLGMPLAVTRGDADFSPIHAPRSWEDRLYIKAVTHQANIDVDEEGTEAAAATAVSVGDTGGCVEMSGPEKTIVLRADRPFLFLIRDVATGAILFMGRVVDPEAR